MFGAVAAVVIAASTARADETAPIRYQARADLMASLKAAKIGCRPLDMILDESAYRLYEAQARDAAFREGTGEAEAVSISYAADEAEKARVDQAGGDLVKVGDSAPAMARYTEYWRSRCEQIRRDPLMSKFFIRRADVKPTSPNPPPSHYSGPMCYKDYCPCQGSQSSLDMMLCDRLEEGLEVGIESMIAGRSLRQSQREINALSR